MNVLIFIALSLQAQVYAIPDSIYPGSRLTIGDSSFLLGDRTQPAPALPRLTIATQGREYSLPFITDPFPPAEEINPKPPILPTYLVPRDLPLGPATVRYGDQIFQAEISSKPFNQIYTLGTFMAYAHQQTGSGPIRRNRLTDPARPGDRVTLWGTGFDRATVSVGGTFVIASVEHQTDGLDRIEFTLPENTPADCTQFVSVNDASLVSIATADWGNATCSYRLGIVPSDLMRLDRGLTVPISTFSFSSDSVDVEFGDYSLTNMPASVTAPPLENANPGCVVQTISEDTILGLNSLNTVWLQPGNPSPLVGPPAKGELVGPNGTRFVADSYYDRFHFSAPMGGEIWKPGQWTFRLLSPVGAGVAVNARPKFQWKTKPDLANYSRDRDLVLEWDPSQGDVNDRVYFRHVDGSTRPVNGVYGHQVSCNASVSSGQLTIPTSLMRSIPWVKSTVTPLTEVDVVFRPSTFRAPDGRYVQVSYN